MPRKDNGVLLSLHRNGKCSLSFRKLHTASIFIDSKHRVSSPNDLLVVLHKRSLNYRNIEVKKITNIEWLTLSDLNLKFTPLQKTWDEVLSSLQFPVSWNFLNRSSSLIFIKDIGNKGLDKSIWTFGYRHAHKEVYSLNIYWLSTSSLCPILNFSRN